MAEACDIFITISGLDSFDQDEINHICERGVSFAPLNDECIYEDNDDYVTWSQTFDADAIDEDDVLIRITNEFDDARIDLDIDFKYYPFSLEEQLEYAEGTGSVFSDDDDFYSDDD